MPIHLECFCGRSIVAQVIPWSEHSGVMAVDKTGRPCCSAWEGEYRDQDTPKGRAAVERQAEISTRWLTMRFYAARHAYKHRWRRSTRPARSTGNYYRDAATATGMYDHW